MGPPGLGAADPISQARAPFRPSLERMQGDAFELEAAPQGPFLSQFGKKLGGGPQLAGAVRSQNRA